MAVFTGFTFVFTMMTNDMSVMSVGKHSLDMIT